MGEHARIAPGIDWVLRKAVHLQDLQAVVEYAARDAEDRPTVAQAFS